MTALDGSMVIPNGGIGQSNLMALVSLPDGDYGSGVPNE
jgi:hypothetical protein